MDPTSGLCRGCFRTLDEIARWSTLSAPAKQQVLAQLPARRGLPSDANKKAPA
jgi:predicted Fe-S protein YdhL (DUF1289 family)